MRWISNAPCHKILFSEAGMGDFQPVNKGQGTEYCWNDRITISGLDFDTNYEFKVFSGNRFSFEERGKTIFSNTISKADEQKLNLIRNPSFENGHFGFHTSVGGLFHIVRGKGAFDGKFAGRIQITTRSYAANKPTLVFLSQVVDTFKRLAGPRSLILSVNSKSERLFGWTSWRAEMHIYFKGKGRPVVVKQEFDMSVPGWQVRVLSYCLDPHAELSRVDVRGVLETYRGGVFWDDFILAEVEENTVY